MCYDPEDNSLSRYGFGFCRRDDGRSQRRRQPQQQLRVTCFLCHWLLDFKTGADPGNG